MLDEPVADAARINSPRQRTDLYPLALAVRHNRRLVTVYRAIAVSAIGGAGEKRPLAL